MTNHNAKKRQVRFGPLIIVILLMAVVLVSSGFSYFYVMNTSDRLQNTIDEIKKTVQEENWTLANQKSTELFDNWDKEKPLMSILIDHRRMEAVEVLISRSNDFVKNKEKIDSLVELNQTAQQLHGIHEGEQPTLSNIF